MTFKPADFHTFEYTSFELDQATWKLDLRYRLVGDVSSYDFVETVELPAPRHQPSEAAIEALLRLCRLTLLAAGVSYFKLAAPQNIRINIAVTQSEIDYLTALIAGGLTEFAYVNKLPHALWPEITADQIIPHEPVALPDNSDHQPLVPVGGGKDSIVTLEALRTAGFSPTLFSVNTYAPIERTAKRAAMPYIYARRRLDAQLTTLNAAGALNGHVPVTAVVSLISLLTATLHGNNAVVMSNERSASVGNVIWEGIEVNHQWSKSLAAETLLRHTIAAVVSPNLDYFSLLRPLSELRITRQFAALRHYHTDFTSCNRAFKLDEAKRAQHWCCDCPKCRFVFLALAPYLSPQELMVIFGHNLLNDVSQLPGYRELLGIQGHKPLECVGEIEECRLALLLANDSGNWSDAAAVQILLSELPDDARPTAEQAAGTFANSPGHCIPDKYLEALYAIA